MRTLYARAWRGTVRAPINSRDRVPVFRAERRKVQNWMNWESAASRVQRSDCGYQISAAKCGDAWRFSAWGPLDRPDLSFWKWLDLQPTKSHYKRGESVPQRMPLLGVFDSAEAARARCEQEFLKGQAGAANTDLAVTHNAEMERVAMTSRVSQKHHDHAGKLA